MGISLGPLGSEEVFDEIRRLVNGYNVAMAGLAAGEAVPTAPTDGRVASLGRPDLVHTSGDTLFTSGTLGQYSDTLRSVQEVQGPRSKVVDVGPWTVGDLRQPWMLRF